MIYAYIMIYITKLDTFLWSLVYFCSPYHFLSNDAFNIIFLTILLISLWSFGIHNDPFLLKLKHFFKNNCTNLLFVWEIFKELATLYRIMYSSLCFAQCLSKFAILGLHFGFKTSKLLNFCLIFVQVLMMFAFFDRKWRVFLPKQIIRK